MSSATWTTSSSGRLAANGGVMQTVALRGFVRADPPEKEEAPSGGARRVGISGRGEIGSLGEEEVAALRMRLQEVSAQFPVTVADFVDHIDHAVEVMGLDHVAISSDFDGGGGVDGWDDASETLMSLSSWCGEGYTEEQIAQLWSGNTTAHPAGGRAGRRRAAVVRLVNQPHRQRQASAGADLPPGAAGAGAAGGGSPSPANDIPAEFNAELRAYEQVEKLQRYRLAEDAEEEFDEDFALAPCGPVAARFGERGGARTPVSPNSAPPSRTPASPFWRGTAWTPALHAEAAPPDPRVLREPLARTQAPLPGAPPRLGESGLLPRRGDGRRSTGTSWRAGSSAGGPSIRGGDPDWEEAAFWALAGLGALLPPGGPGHERLIHPIMRAVLSWLGEEPGAFRRAAHGDELRLPAELLPAAGRDRGRGGRQDARPRGCGPLHHPPRRRNRGPAAPPPADHEVGADRGPAGDHRAEHRRLHAADHEQPSPLDHPPGERAAGPRREGEAADLVPDGGSMSRKDEILEVSRTRVRRSTPPVRAPRTFHTRITSKYYGDGYHRTGEEGAVTRRSPGAGFVWQGDDRAVIGGPPTVRD